MAQGRAAEAAEAIGKAELFFSSSASDLPRCQDDSWGTCRATARSSRRSLAEVTRAGCVPLEMYGRLYLGIADLRHGRGRARLAAFPATRTTAATASFVRWANRP
jgi:hypothetical protein